MYPDLSHAACPSFGVISNTAHRASVAGYQKQSSNFLISLVSTPLLRASKSPLSTVGWGNSAPFVVVRGLPAAFMSYLISPPMRSPRKHSSISGVGWGDIFPASNRPCLPLSRTSVQTSAHSDVWGSVMETSSHCRPVPNPDPCSPPIKCPTWQYTHLTSCGPHPTHICYDAAALSRTRGSVESIPRVLPLLGWRLLGLHWKQGITLEVSAWSSRPQAPLSYLVSFSSQLTLATSHMYIGGLM